MIKSIVLSILILMFVSCADRRDAVVVEVTSRGNGKVLSELPAKLAILPIINHTLDVDGAFFIRERSFEYIKSKSLYELQDMNETDMLLNEEGITDGGQLGLVSNLELFEILDSDGLLFIEVFEMEYKTLAIYEERRVKVRYSLFNRDNLCWEKIGESAVSILKTKTIKKLLNDPSDGLKMAADDLGEQLLVKGVKGAFLKHELRFEIEGAIANALENFPIGNMNNEVYLKKLIDYKNILEEVVEEIIEEEKVDKGEEVVEELKE